ncbi:PREDICTED: arrestin homolog [Dinoponera quadriceps]|uniref:Arrestin homolog n=1 Tax=Dinoponera quadriceps TaxID=609295 RepID=A0A6P3XE54_DINQU|nr:PREDICTED: arrestin homolog [Dinoponera quadriceps]XP_014476644.1 PREDICTED: arrestin homolog [Dinoponera quadriceps]XP_014476645.1 PREDICTED: arrestin homolog [Dinoponera quadriceps]XP_014476646.1 PREDICTED: arrestin homolog [Dinoponera quadriceps]
MAENGDRAAAETTVVRSSEDEEQRKELYPETVECKNFTAEGCDAKDEKVESEGQEEGNHCRTESKSDQALRLQTPTQQAQQTDMQADRKTNTSPDHISDSAFNNSRVYKKSSLNNKLTLYLASRDLIVSESKIDKLQGVLLVDPDYLQEKKVYGQVTLTFRYGREDEEVMGLKFCNEAVMCLAQLYPPYAGADYQENTTQLQEALIKRLGPNAHAFTMEITPLAPPSVQLVPAKEYSGAPIGTSYDVKAYVAERADEKFHRKTTIRMGIRVIQRTTKPPLPSTTMYSVPPFQVLSIPSRIQVCKTRMESTENEIIEDDENMGPHAAVEKPFLLSDGRVGLEAKLDRAIYAHGDSITVHVYVSNNSSKSVRRIKVFIVQHVDVCMFSNGKFKNVVALVSSQEGCPVGPGGTLIKSYSLRPIKGSTKNWIALEDSYTKTGATLASTVICPGNGPEDRNVFAIYVSYYVKIKLLVSAMGGKVSLKLPFTLMHSNTDPDLVGFPSPVREPPKQFGKDANEITDKSSKSDGNNHRKKENKLEAIKEQEKESRVTDVDLIEHCEESDST